MARSVRLDLDQEHLTVGPGEAGRLAVTLRNTSDLVHHLQLEVRGLPAGARAVSEPPTVKLLPGATAQCSLTLELPAAPPADAGPHVLGVLARSPHHREVSRCEEVRLDVPALPALAMTVEPELVRAGRRARFTATLVNEGNTGLTTRIAGTDPERRVRFSITPQELVLPARRTAQAVVTVVADRPWTGQEARRPLTLTVEAGDVRAASTVTLVQSPRLPPVLLRSLAGVLGLLLLAGTIVLADQVLGEEEGGGAATPESSEPAAAPSPSGPVAPSLDPSPTAPSPTAPPSSVEPSPSPDEAPTPSPSPSPTPVPSPLRTVPLTDEQDSPAVRPTGSPVTRLGFTVVAAPDADGTPAGCEAVSSLAVREAGEDDYVTAVDPADQGRCQDVPLTVEFVEDVRPVTDVVLQVVADGDYLIGVQSEDGGTEEVRGRAQDGVLRVVEGERVRALTLAPDRKGTAPERVGLVQVQYRAAPT